MCGGSGGSKGGGGGGGGSTNGDAGQPGEVVRQANQMREKRGAEYDRLTSQIATIDAEIAKTNRAYDAATQAGDMAQRKMLRKLRSSLEDKKNDLIRARRNVPAYRPLPK